MNTLSDRQKVLLYRKNMGYLELEKPKFFIGNKVKIVDFDFGSSVVSEVWENTPGSYLFGEWKKLDQVWTYLDKCRKDKLRKIGMIIRLVNGHKTKTRPYQVSQWSYQVLFEDKSKIYFCEEHLKKVK